MSWMRAPLMIVFLVSGIFLIMLVLVQTSRGTGLTGMFGGAGEKSAFGTQTGSLLGKLTAIAATAFLMSALAYAIASQTAP